MSEINISSELRYSLQNNLILGNVEIGVFDPAYDDVKESLLMDGFPRFLQKLAREESQSKARVMVTHLASSDGNEVQEYGVQAISIGLTQEHIRYN